MKINVIIDLEDFWLDEETISEAIQKQIKREVINEVWAKVQTKIEDQITRVVKEDVEKVYCRKIQGFVSDFLKNGTLPSYYNGKEMVTIEEWIKEQFTKNTGWNSPKDQIEKLAKQFGAEMKNKYDLMFASQIVIKLNEQGMLKEDIAKILLENNAG